MWKITVEKDKKNLFEPPDKDKAQDSGDDPTAIAHTNDSEGRTRIIESRQNSFATKKGSSSQARSERESSVEEETHQQPEGVGTGANSLPKWLSTPELAFPTEEQIKDSYHNEELKSEPSKYTPIANNNQDIVQRRQKVRLVGEKEEERRASGTSSERRALSRPVRGEPLARPVRRRKSKGHIAYRRSKKHRRKKKKENWAFRVAVVFLLIILFALLYEQRISLKGLAESLLQQFREYSSSISSSSEGGGDIIPIIVDSEEEKNAPLALSELDCYDLMPRTGKTHNLSELDIKTKFAIAECHYLRGNYRYSYQLLQKKEQQLQDESLLLYTILLLKRRKFSAVKAFLQGKCVQPENSQQFFPCLAQSLSHMIQFGYSSSIAQPSTVHQDNSYSAIFWMLQALRESYDINSDYMAKTTLVGERSNRRVALSYVYETLVRFYYHHGSVKQLKQLRTLAAQKLRNEHTTSSWWVRFITKLKTTEIKKREVLNAVSSKDNYSKMYDNLDFLSIIGMESIYIGYSKSLDNVINKIWQYQKRNWKYESKESIKFLEQWQIRILLSRKSYRIMMKKLKNYAYNYGKDYFYYFFRGVALIGMMGKGGEYKIPTALFSHSISLRDRWENNYGYALSLLKSRKATLLANHMHKLERMASTPVRKKWLFLLRAEIKISTGKHDVAITDLRDYIAKHPRSFKAHRLLVAAYMRANRQQEAIVVRKAYDRLQKHTPFYSTEESRNSPLGPFALLF